NWGLEDLPDRQARQLLPAEALIGVATHDLAAAEKAFADDACDYVAFGPVFGSATKPGREPRGLETLARVARAKTKPLVAIGGLSEKTIDAVFDAGADSTAMIEALLSGGNIDASCCRLLVRAR